MAIAAIASVRPMTDWICAKCHTRLTGETAGACPACGGEDVIPVSSPRGQQLAGASSPPVVQAAAPVAIPGNMVVCPNCYAVAKPMKSGPSSIAQLILVAVMLGALVFFWPVGLFLLLILIIYSAQRTRTLCANCGNEGVIPGNSERAQQILAQRR